MKEGPDISIVAALIGNPACANMLTALMVGPALTATELSQEAGLTLSTVSGHLARLKKAGLVATERQGRHRYYRLADRDVATALEALMPVAARAGHLRIRTGPRDPELRHARSCYDHLAGDLAVAMYDSFLDRRLMTRRGGELRLTAAGQRFFAKLEGAKLEGAKLEGAKLGTKHGTKLGIGREAPRRRRGGARRPLCRPCLDWSARRMHLGGTLGAAILAALDPYWRDQALERQRRQQHIVGETEGPLREVARPRRLFLEDRRLVLSRQQRHDRRLRLVTGEAGHRARHHDGLADERLSHSFGDVRLTQ